MSDYLEHGVDHKLGSDAQLCQLGRRLHRAQALQHEQRVLDLAVWESVLQRAARIHGEEGKLDADVLCGHAACADDLGGRRGAVLVWTLSCMLRFLVCCDGAWAKPMTASGARQRSRPRGQDSAPVPAFSAGCGFSNASGRPWVSTPRKVKASPIASPQAARKRKAGVTASMGALGVIRLDAPAISARQRDGRAYTDPQPVS